MITASVIADEALDSAALKSYLWANSFPALPGPQKGSDP